jgi:hypothetical protein
VAARPRGDRRTSGSVAASGCRHRRPRVARVDSRVVINDTPTPYAPDSPPCARDHFDAVAGAVAAARAALTPPAADTVPARRSRIARLVGLTARCRPAIGFGASALTPSARRGAPNSGDTRTGFHLLATARAIASRFDAAGIRALAVKGPVWPSQATVTRCDAAMDSTLDRARAALRAANLPRRRGLHRRTALVDAARRPSRCAGDPQRRASGVDVELHGGIHPLVDPHLRLRWRLGDASRGEPRRTPRRRSTRRHAAPWRCTATGTPERLQWVATWRWRRARATASRRRGSRHAPHRPDTGACSPRLWRYNGRS